MVFAAVIMRHKILRKPLSARMKRCELVLQQHFLVILTALKNVLLYVS